MQSDSPPSAGLKSSSDLSQSSQSTSLSCPWHWNTSLSTSHSVNLEGILSSTWYQGRGVYGGIIAALFMEAFIQLVPKRSPRTLTIHFCAPALEGPAQVKAHLEKEGKSVSHLRGTLEGDSGLMATASATFALPRSVQWSYSSDPFPEIPPWQEVPEVPKNFPLMPAYCNEMSFRFCLGDPPYSGSAHPLLGGWCDFRESYPIDFSLIAALLDAWPPACFPSLKKPVPAASVDLTYHFLTQDLSRLSRPFVYKGFVQSAEAGYLEERDFLWDAQGHPIASSRQWIALGKASS